MRSGDDAGGCFCNLLVLPASTSADTDCAGDVSVAGQWNATGEGNA
ncbi:hypothetical protein V1638_14565 [Pseudarthrobacter sp. J64]|nr:hypothetical protein [Pseudarthrobacter sp. J64]MEE2570608.1 hypothetical protein [Pseudarthrobacter sp. J64]